MAYGGRGSLVVFVCSTFADLSDERRAVIDAIRRLQLEHDSMEFFGARAELPLETCLSEVRRSNILVVIVGHRYGTTVPQLRISFPQAEYDEGYRFGKPSLVYFRDDDVPVLPKHVEQETRNVRALRKWKTVLRRRHTVATFRSASDLAVQVSTDLARTLGAVEEARQVVQSEMLTSSPTLWSYLGNLVADATARGMSEQTVISAVRDAMHSVLPPRQPEKPSVFVSFAADDSHIGNALVSALTEAGIAAFTERSGQVAIRAGSQPQPLAAIGCFVFVVSRKSADTLQSEWTLAIYRRIASSPAPAVIPVLLDAAAIPPLFRDVVPIDVRHLNFRAAIKKVVVAVKERLAPKP